MNTLTPRQKEIIVTSLLLISREYDRDAHRMRSLDNAGLADRFEKFSKEISQTAELIQSSVVVKVQL